MLCFTCVALQPGPVEPVSPLKVSQLLESSRGLTQDPEKLEALSNALPVVWKPCFIVRSCALLKRGFRPILPFPGMSDSSNPQTYPENYHIFCFLPF